jgi:UDP-N-acetylmuramate--alanine ligase
MNHVHLLGIGGAGVSALARVFLARGDHVTGCDVHESDTTRALAAEGATVCIGHDPAHVVVGLAGERPRLLVHTTPVRGAGVAELEAARRAGVEVRTRAETLAGLIAASESITVAGTHAKTTTTFMVGHILTAAGLDPSVLVGDGASSRAGRGRLLVAEADESDGTLAMHRPTHGVLTSVDYDHPNHFASIEEVDRLFRAYLGVIPGTAVVCADYPRALAMPVGGRRVTYGFAASADYRCEAVATTVGSGACESPNRGRVWRGGAPLVEIQLKVPGWHNLQNATGALATTVELGVGPEPAAAALATYPGARRRLERLGVWRGATVYDDYGHNPGKVRATLDAARGLPHRRLVLVFQPHRYSRVQAMRDQFVESLCGADVVIVTEIYAAGEENPGGVSGADLAGRLPGGRFAPDLAGARAALEGLVEEGDLVLLMGAGDIRKLGDELANAG